MYTEDILSPQRPEELSNKEAGVESWQARNGTQFTLKRHELVCDYIGLLRYPRPSVADPPPPQLYNDCSSEEYW